MTAETGTTYEIGDLAKEFGLTMRAIRFYEDKGLLTPKRIGLRREFSEDDRMRLAAIVRLTAMGFTLAEIGEFAKAGKLDGGKLRLTEADVKTQILASIEQRDKADKATRMLGVLLEGMR